MGTIQSKSVQQEIKAKLAKEQEKKLAKELNEEHTSALSKLKKWIKKTS